MKTEPGKMGYETSPLLSIAIPTRNRSAYLKDLVGELLQSKRRDFEIVVQDNSDGDEFCDWVDRRSDSRLKYGYCAERLSVVENCDRAIAKCAGAFVCMLGDDDGLMLDEALKLLRQMDFDVDAVMSKVLNYVWPDLDHPLLRGYGGKLYLRPVKGVTRSNAFESRCERVVSHGGAFGLEDLPCVYHGFVRRSVLDRLRQLTGTCFPGPSPDMANAIGICTQMKRLFRTNQVLVITGHSRQSTAGAGTQKKHHGEIGRQSHLPAATAAEWLPFIPRFWSGPTIYAQSLASALAKTGCMVFRRPSWAPLYAACLVYHPEYLTEIKDAISASGRPAILVYASILPYVALIILRRATGFATRIVRSVLPGRAHALNAQSISEAIRAFRAMQAT